MTLTTVGYGDICPVTPLGKFLGSIIALIGIGFFALPAGVLAAAFADELAQQRLQGVPTPQRAGSCSPCLDRALSAFDRLKGWSRTEDLSPICPRGGLGRASSAKLLIYWYAR